MTWKRSQTISASVPLCAILHTPLLSQLHYSPALKFTKSKKQLNTSSFCAILEIAVIGNSAQVMNIISRTDEQTY